MKHRTMFAIGATTLGLTLIGATAASALPTPDGIPATEWARQMGHGVGNPDAPGYGLTDAQTGYGNVDDEDWPYGMMDGTGLGDPADCLYDDATVDRDQIRDQLHDTDGDGTWDRTRMRDRVDA